MKVGFCCFWVFLTCIDRMRGSFQIILCMMCLVLCPSLWMPFSCHRRQELLSLLSSHLSQPHGSILGSGECEYPSRYFCLGEEVPVIISETPLIYAFFQLSSESVKRMSRSKASSADTLLPCPAELSSPIESKFRAGNS